MIEHSTNTYKLKRLVCSVDTSKQTEKLPPWFHNEAGFLGVKMEAEFDDIAKQGYVRIKSKTIGVSPRRH